MNNALIIKCRLIAVVGLLAGIAALAILLDTSKSASAIELSVLGRYESGVFDRSASEIVAYDPATRRLFVINSGETAVDVLDISDPARPVKTGSIDASTLGGAANSVDAMDGIVAAAIEAHDPQADGRVAFFNSRTLELIDTVPVGPMPDMLMFTPDGDYLLTANEGEPDDEYTRDPEGSVSVVDLRAGVRDATVRTAGFSAYNGDRETLIAEGVRIFGPGASVAQDLEPEYIAVPAGSGKAYVSLQENNALAEVDIAGAAVTDIVPLGYKDHERDGNELDVSDRDDMINIRNWPVSGMYQPDAIAAYRVDGRTLIVTANEGDIRDYDGYSEERHVADLTLDPTAYPDRDWLQRDFMMGHLTVTAARGDSDADGDYERLYTFGARSFSIFDTGGRLVYDSGSDFERRLARRSPAFFNVSNDNNRFDNRSDNKGPEPEGVTLGRVDGRAYAFIGLERPGGVMVYDITDPRRVRFIQYINPRDFTEPPCRTPEDKGRCKAGRKNANPAAGDLGPEGLRFISRSQSPIARPLLVVGNEVSGSTTVYRIDPIY